VEFGLSSPPKKGAATAFPTPAYLKYTNEQAQNQHFSLLHASILEITSGFKMCYIM